MAELRPYPFEALLRRMFDELERHSAIFDLPVRKFFGGESARDFGVKFHDRQPSSPLGPAAGPHTQMAQNIVLSWLAGSRVIELKTVQEQDELEIARPCIDMATVGYNVEWSQELKLEQSLEEYVKAWMLIAILRKSGKIPIEEGFDTTVFDMSVGYNLAGIKSKPVQAFMQGMRDAGSVIERLRGQIPDQFAEYRDIAYPAQLSNTLTLSTFHGCPPAEIEAIALHLMNDLGLHTILKLNPTLLGPGEVTRLLHDELGYHDLQVPSSAFEGDLQWHDAVPMLQRLRKVAEQRGLGFGVKLTNTLIVNNHRDFFPATEKQMYLSGQPLHVLAMALVQRVRDSFGPTLPISFSAGIDRANFADAVALGLTPVTVCTDFLRAGGYGRAVSYYKNLSARMEKVGAANIGEYVIRAFGHGESTLQEAVQAHPGANHAACLRALGDGSSLQQAAGPEFFKYWFESALTRNTKTYVEQVMNDRRYHQDKNSKPPKKQASTLEIFDCLTCDKCLPVCPNDANFSFALPQESLPIEKAVPQHDGFTVTAEERLFIKKRHQIGNFADFCNECGNCDVFCPELGGPYVLKPRFFGSVEDYNRGDAGDGFYIEPRPQGPYVLARFSGRPLELEHRGPLVEFRGEGFALKVDLSTSPSTVSGDATAEVDLTHMHIMNAVALGVLESQHANPIKYLSAARP